MKFASNKRIYLFTVTILLLLLLVLPLKNHFTNVEASSNDYQIRMLEVTENGVSELASLKTGISGLIIDTMSMKRFVALRDDLDGRYDAIYIGKGTYSTSGVSGKDHNTKAVMNDITNLKAKEITNYFINKGLYVLINKEPFDKQTTNQRGILYNTFNTYRTLTPKSNVKFVDNNELNTWIENLKKDPSAQKDLLKQRPRIQITNKANIIDYSQNQEHVYKPGNTLSFKFNVSNVNSLNERPILAKLYMSVDKSIKMTENDVVAVQTLNQDPNGEIVYKLPNTYSGLLYWKLEIVDHLNPNKLKDFDSGTIQFLGKKTIVNILQVLPTIPNSERSSSLLRPENMTQSFLSNSSYELKITTKTISEFNTDIATQYTKDNKYGLNGVYDMLIFGFRDIYNDKAVLSELATQAVIDFTEVTKQSVMFTHDTVYQNNSNWVKNFKKITGQIEPETNLGLNAPNPSTTVKPINDGLLTQYPFYLSTINANNEQTNIITPQIATTHNQYFTLNLEDPSVIPWYNIIGSSRDVDDSWNHYYTYSKGNVTYSGTGHVFGTSSVQFPVWEQKLFVNTMYRAYIGANHAPEITVSTPQQDEIKPSYQNELLIDYVVEDPDLKDRDLFTTIRFKSGNTYLPNTGMAEKAILSGETIHQVFPNPLPRGGKLTIEITARDKQGAYAAPKIIDITILEAKSNLELSRELSTNVSTNGEVAKNEPFTITYIIQAKPVPFEEVSTTNQSSEHQVISNIVFRDILPANIKLEASGLPDGMTNPSGSVGTGLALEKSLNNITYTLKNVNGIKTFLPDSNEPIKFSINVSANVAATYKFDNALVDFVDIHAVPSASPTPTATAVVTASPTPSTTNFNPSVSTTGSGLGIAGDYNAFIFGKATVTASLKGNLAAGGDVTTSGVDINMSNGNKVPYAIVTGGNLNFTNGTVYGNIIHQGEFNRVDSGSIISGTYTKVNDTLIDFSAAKKYYENLSNQLAAVPQNGTTELKDGGLYVTGNRAVNIFNFTANYFNQTGWTNVTALSGSTMIYTITGSTVNVHKAFALPQDTTGNNILYNFPDATTVNISGVEIRGSILAPKAALSISNGNVYGNVIAASLNTASCLIDILPYRGPVPVPTPTSTPSPTPTSIPSPTVTPSPTSNPPVRTTIKFPEMTITAIDRITTLELSGAQLLLGDSQMLHLIIKPSEKFNQLIWTSSNDNIVSVSPLGVVFGNKVGSAEITVASNDGSNLISKATVTVLDPQLNIEGPNRALVNEKIDFTADYKNTNESGVQYSWSIVDANGLPTNNVTLDTLDSTPKTTSFTANKSGEYRLTVTVTSNLNSIGIRKTIPITVGLDSLTITGPKKVPYEGTTDLSVSTIPDSASNEQFEWSLVNDSDLKYAGFVTVDNPIPVSKIITYDKRVSVKGLESKNDIQIQVKAVGITSNIHNIIVPKPGLVFYPDSGIIMEGESLNLLTLLNTRDPFGALPTSLINKMHWEIVSNKSGEDASKPAILQVQNGLYRGISKGQATIRAYYFTLSNEMIEAFYTIYIIGSQDTIENRY
ncbi:DUF5057 domain-containing protein [Paenibacillus sp. FSL H7-0737]|uniref:DUF5057 domain-containing protein n=1 Tax=Paenibacillus sp. FSL H7-0737 TaxID=1536775 RepID=UPI0006932C48|nr:DUF5057 domain-containing protein [Paenibacillus sp. FSL H7-0737]